MEEAAEVGAGVAPSKMEVSGVAFLFRGEGRSVLSLQALLLILLVFHLGVPVFCFC